MDLFDQAALSILFRQLWRIGSRLRSSIKASRRFLSSCFEATRICRSIERASLEKKPSIRLSRDAWVGVKVKVKRPGGCAASQAVVSRETCAEWLSRMISIAVSAGYAVSKSSRNSMNSRLRWIFDQRMDVTA